MIPFVILIWKCEWFWIVNILRLRIGLLFSFDFGFRSIQIYTNGYQIKKIQFVYFFCSLSEYKSLLIVDFICKREPY